MTTDFHFETREDCLSSAEFAALARNADGDVVELSLAYPFITQDQRAQLTGDDLSRMDDLDEEMRCLMAEAKEEYFAHRRDVAATAKAAGYVGQPVPLDPRS